MSKWYTAVINDDSNIPQCIEHFERELADAKSETSLLRTKTIERHAAELPGIVEYRYTQLQEVEAILEYLNTRLKKLRSKCFRKYLETYNRQLTSRDAEKYVDGDDEVYALTMIVNEFALVRNKYISLHKGLDIKHWQISNIVKLRCAGLDDAMLE